MSGSLRRCLVPLAAGALLTSGGYADAATTAEHGKPVIESAPAQPPPMVRVHGACALPAQTQTATGGHSTADLLWVRAHPTGVVAIWIPGLNAKRCVARRTTSGAARAERIAIAIRHSRAFPTKPLPCPYDDNTQVRLYFTYADGGDEYTEVSLSGCRPISAPDRRSRWSDEAVEKPLRKPAPAAWSSYLPN